jgi:hypothetical protein
MDKKTLMKALNEDLAGELKAIIQYLTYSSGSCSLVSLGSCSALKHTDYRREGGFRGYRSFIACHNFEQMMDLKQLWLFKCFIRSTGYGLQQVLRSFARKGIFV